MKDVTERRYPKVSGNEMMEILAVRRPPYSDGPSAATMNHLLKVPDARAAFAMACIERWAMVAAELDGEDSAGRSRLRRMTPNELVDHACEVSAIAFAKFANRGWLLDQPPFADIVDAVKDVENNND